MTPDQPGNIGVEARCLAALRGHQATLATAESLTAGSISAALASVPGASDVLRGGLVAYATDIKVTVLGVDPLIVSTVGVVSAECAAAMASAARELFGATWAVSATGVAGPDEQEGKAVGTVFVGVAGPTDVQVEALSLTGSRDQIRAGAVQASLALLARAVA